MVDFRKTGHIIIIIIRNLMHAETVSLCTRLSFLPPPFREPGYKDKYAG